MRFLNFLLISEKYYQNNLEHTGIATFLIWKEGTKIPDRTPLSLHNIQFSTRQFYFMMNNLVFIILNLEY